jgi:hypothetical protein
VVFDGPDRAIACDHVAALCRKVAARQAVARCRGGAPLRRLAARCHDVIAKDRAIKAVQDRGAKNNSLRACSGGEASAMRRLHGKVCCSNGYTHCLPRQ